MEGGKEGDPKVHEQAGTKIAITSQNVRQHTWLQLEICYATPVVTHLLLSLANNPQDEIIIIFISARYDPRKKGGTMQGVEKKG